MGRHQTSLLILSKFKQINYLPNLFTYQSVTGQTLTHYCELWRSMQIAIEFLPNLHTTTTKHFYGFNPLHAIGL